LDRLLRHIDLYNWQGFMARNDVNSLDMNRFSRPFGAENDMIK